MSTQILYTPLNGEFFNKTKLTSRSKMSKPIPPFTEVQHFWKNEILKKGVSGTFTIDPADGYEKYVFDIGLTTRVSQKFFDKFTLPAREPITIVGMTDNRSRKLSSECRLAWNDLTKIIKFVGRYEGDPKFPLEPPCSDVSYLERDVIDPSKILFDHPDQDCVCTIEPDGTPTLIDTEEDRST